MLDAAQESLQQFEIENWLRNRALGSGLDFVFEALDLFLDIRHARVCPDADHE